MMETPEISIDYSLTYREYVAGQKLAMRQSLWTLVFHLLTQYIALVLALVLTVMALVNLAGGYGYTVPAMLPLIFLFYFLPALGWWGWRYRFKRLRRSAGEDPHVAFLADQHSFVRRMHGMGELTWLWSATQGISDNKKVVLIAARKGAYIIIPRRALDDAQIRRMKQMLQENKGH